MEFKIKTRFNFKDKVFFLDSNKVIFGNIDGIRIIKTSLLESIVYSIKHGKEITPKKENNVFKTKEELLKSL